MRFFLAYTADNQPARLRVLHVGKTVLSWCCQSVSLSVRQPAENLPLVAKLQMDRNMSPEW